MKQIPICCAWLGMILGKLFITHCRMDHILGSFDVLCPCMCRANYRGIGLNRFGGIFVAALVC